MFFSVFFANFAPEDTWASDPKEKKTEKQEEKRIIRRKRPLEEAAKSDDKTARDDSGPPVLGAQTAYGHKEFDVALNKSGKIDAVLLIDASRSMQRTDPQRLRIQGAKLFLRFLSEGDRVAVIQFDKETKTLTPLTSVTPEFLSALDKQIESIQDEGNFTDLYTPIIEAFKILSPESRPDTQKCVVLLSDGQMDPHPSTGTKAELTEKLKKTNLPEFREQGIKIYSLALSEEADRTLLADIASLTDGLHWYAPTAESVHRDFSDLFLTLKKPQVTAIEGSHFNVDGSVSEATFFISRRQQEQEVWVVDPLGKEFSNNKFPQGVKWYRGDLFDVITVRSPIPGPWGIKGVQNPEGYATFLSDLKLQVHWPATNLKAGDSMVFMARLTDKDISLSNPELMQLITYSYKIFVSSDAQLFTQGAMNDKGQEGDQKAGDGIFTATLKIDRAGEYKAFISANSPTFNISAGLIDLVQIPADESIGLPMKYKAVLGPQAVVLKKLEVLFAYQKKGAEKQTALPLTNYKLSDTEYHIPLETLPGGEYTISARVSGVDERQQQVNSVSESVEYTSSSPVPVETIAAPETAKVEVKEAVSEDLIWGLASCLLSLIWSGSLVFWFYKFKAKASSSSIPVREPYSIPEKLNRQIQDLRKKASTTMREPVEEDLALFGSFTNIFEKGTGKKAFEEKASNTDGAELHQKDAPPTKGTPKNAQEDISEDNSSSTEEELSEEETH